MNPDPIETINNYTNISVNSSIIRSQSQTESVGADLETRYFYSTDTSLSGEPYITDLISKNIVGTPLLEQYFKGTEKLVEQKTVYGKEVTTSNLLIPKFVYSKKGTDSSTNLLEKKMTFDLYDSRGMLLQYTPENGMPVSTIWGYNRTMPIAELNNVLYANIIATVISDLQTKSNADNDNCNLPSCKEQILRVALNSLRNTFPNAMITTWTFDPIIGKTSVTDSKGDKLFYEYDEYNRAKAIRDKDYNILSENQYHFSTQN